MSYDSRSPMFHYSLITLGFFPAEIFCVLIYYSILVVQVGDMSNAASEVHDGEQKQLMVLYRITTDRGHRH